MGTENGRFVDPNGPLAFGSWRSSSHFPAKRVNSCWDQAISLVER